MNKENHSDSNQWYTLWLQQTQAFFQANDENLKKIFKDMHPEKHQQQLEAWLENLKQHWQMMSTGEQQKNFQAQWQAMLQMWNEAADLMMKEWLKRGVNQPIHNAHELYELWLKCCSDVFKQHSSAQRMKDNYNEFVTAAMDFWRGVLPK